MGAESPLRRLDEPAVGIRQGDRIIVRGNYVLGPGVAQGPITQDNEGLWWVEFDNGWADSYNYHLLEKAYEL